jgi:hypothetical protein
MANPWNQRSGGLPRAAPGIAAAAASGKVSERCLRARIALRVLRAHREPAIAKARQILADGALMHPDAEVGGNPALQVLPAPAHHPVPRGVRASLDPSAKLRHPGRRKMWNPHPLSSGRTVPPDLRHCPAARPSGKLSPGPFPDPPHPARSAGPFRRSRLPASDPSPSPLEPMRDDGSSSHTGAKAGIGRAALASRRFPAAPRTSPAVRSRRVILIPDIAPPLIEGCGCTERTACDPPRVTSANRWHNHRFLPASGPCLAPDRIRR